MSKLIVKNAINLKLRRKVFMSDTQHVEYLK